MDFVAVVDQVIALLRQRGLVTYRTLKLQFTLDDEQLATLKDELLYSQPQVVDDAGRGFIWTGEMGTAAPATARAATRVRAPLTYTPPYLAEKILTSRSALEGERKQVTVLFADIKDSLELIRSLDPRSRPAAPGSCPARHDGRGTPVRRDRKPGAGRRHHGPVWCPAVP